MALVTAVPSVVHVFPRVAGTARAPCYPAAVVERLKIAIVGPGRLGRALALALKSAGYPISEIISRDAPGSKRRAQALARTVRARAATMGKARLDAGLIWFCVPDGEIARAASDLAKAVSWKGKLAFHCSGALTSDALDVLRRRGARVASVHPLMTFVHGSVPSLTGAPFAVEGDAAALRLAGSIVRSLGGEVLRVRKENKVAYHAWATFLSPLMVAALVTAEQAAHHAGISSGAARKKMLPIVKQTLANYAKLGPARAFSGPLVRGDVSIVREHLQALKRTPAAREVYVALARSALQFLPVRNGKKLKEALERAED